MWVCSGLFLALAAVSSAQLLRNGPCPEVKPAVNISQIKPRLLMGMWYEQMHTMRWSGAEMECNLQLLTYNSARNFSYDSFSYSPTIDREFYESGEIIVKPYNATPPNKGFVLDIVGDDERSNVFLLGTDYMSYATFWTCTPAEDDLHYENVMIMTRKRRASNETIQSALKALDANNITRDYLMPTRQRLCPEFQEQDTTTTPPTTTTTSTTTTTTTTTTPPPSTTAGFTRPPFTFPTRRP